MSGLVEITDVQTCFIVTFHILYFTLQVLYVYLPVDESSDKDTADGASVKTEEKIAQQVEEQQVQSEQVLQQVCL